MQTETGSPGTRHRFGQEFSDIFQFVNPKDSGNLGLLRSVLSSKKRICPPVFASLESWVDKSLEEFSNGTQVQSPPIRNCQSSSEVLVRESYGGGSKSFRLLGHLTLNAKLLEKLSESVRAIPVGFTAIHFRNTDYRSSYESLKNAIESVSPDIPIMLATDDETVFGRLERDFPTQQFIPSPSSESKREALTQTEVAVLELAVISRAKSLLLIPLDSQTKDEPNYSGFGLLAQHLWMVRQIQTRGSIEYFRQLIVLARASQARRRNLLRLGVFILIRGPGLFSNAFFPRGFYKQLTNIGQEPN